LRRHIEAAICFEHRIVENNSQFLIDKSLAPYFENVVYVGLKPVRGIQLQIIYQPQYAMHDKWSNEAQKLAIHSTREQRLFNRQEFAHLTSSNIGIQNYPILKRRYGDVDTHAYSVVKKFAIDMIKHKILQFPIARRWEDFLLMSGFQYLRLYLSAQDLINHFFNWFSNYAFDTIAFDESHEDCVIDFVGHIGNERHCAFFFWQHPTANNLLHIEPKIAKVIDSYSNLKSLAIISTVKVAELSLDKIEKYNSQNAADVDQTGWEDLFYWNNDTYFNS
jgi:hypothetical protein